ncbi:unnamed protein product [Cunninghamella blakesleeana]
MAFAQQQRRPRYHSHTSFSSTSSIDESFVTTTSPTVSILSPGPRYLNNTTTTPSSTTTTTSINNNNNHHSNNHNNNNNNNNNTSIGFSDSENDWHIISSTTRSLSSTTTSSNTPAIPSTIERRDSISIEPSEPESFSSFKLSDTESFSDGDLFSNNNLFDNLPSHDGTGTFHIQEFTSDDDIESLSSHSNTNTNSNQNNQKIILKRNRRASFRDFDPSSSSMPNILLPYGGIHLPTFVKQQQPPSLDTHLPSHPINQTIASPTFQPTVIPQQLILSSSEEEEGISYNKEKSDDSNTTYSSDQIKFTRRRKRNLDSIPTHHPSIPGTMTSFAILSAIWNNLRRLTNHLIENDTNTADAFTSLVSEGTLEGCLPFGSHLHMELAAGLRPNYTREALPGYL